MNVIKTAKFSEEPAYDGGKPYISKEIKGPNTAFSACLHLIFQHTADVYETMLQIVAEKYGHSVEEMMEAVSQDERFKNMMINPVLKGLDYFDKDDLAKVVPPPQEHKEEPIEEKMSNLSLNESTRVIKIKKTAVKKVVKAKTKKEETDA
jgi:hypothetical protein